MKSFSELGIPSNICGLVGDKININRILDKEIIISKYQVKPSKYGDDKKYLELQIEFEKQNRVIFVGSKSLIDVITKIPDKDLPFKTIIVEENKRLKFT